MTSPVQLLPRTRGATPAMLCLLTILTSLPIFALHWAFFAWWMRTPGFAAVARVEVIAALNQFLLGLILANLALVAWLWSRRRSPAPQPRAGYLIVLVEVSGYVAIGIAYGPITSPVSTVMISALVVGLALIGRRPTLVGFLYALVAVTAADWLVLGGVMPYAPALLPATFADGVPATWWSLWQDLMFGIAMLFGLFLMLLLFERIDAQRDQLERLSRTDGLTGLSNRRHFLERLAIEVQRRDRYGQPFSIVLCDADHFKKVNDTHGHHAGDEVLVALGRLLDTSLRIPGDVAARLGGEEFALLLTECRAAEARTVCERLRAQLAAQEFGAPGRSFRVTLSMGVVECDSGGTEELLKAADRNLYQAKRNGRDCLVLSVHGTAAAAVESVS